jgi:hypothetical protein
MGREAGREDENVDAVPAPEANLLPSEDGCEPRFQTRSATRAKVKWPHHPQSPRIVTSGCAAVAGLPPIAWCSVGRSQIRPGINRGTNSPCGPNEGIVGAERPCRNHDGVAARSLANWPGTRWGLYRASSFTHLSQQGTPARWRGAASPKIAALLGHVARPLRF